MLRAPCGKSPTRLRQAQRTRRRCERHSRRTCACFRASAARRRRASSRRARCDVPAFQSSIHEDSRRPQIPRTRTRGSRIRCERRRRVRSLPSRARQSTEGQDACVYPPTSCFPMEAQAPRPSGTAARPSRESPSC